MASTEWAIPFLYKYTFMELDSFFVYLYKSGIDDSTGNNGRSEVLLNTIPRALHYRTTAKWQNHTQQVAA
jgi:hypothetical protein